MHGVEMVTGSSADAAAADVDSQVTWKIKDLSLSSSMNHNRDTLDDNDGPDADPGSGGEASAGPTVGGVRLDSLISQVNDLLPNLGAGFIEVSRSTRPVQRPNDVCIKFGEKLPYQSVRYIVLGSISGSTT